MTEKFEPLSAEELAMLSRGLQGRSDGLKGEQHFVDDPEWTTERAKRILEEVAIYRLEETKPPALLRALGNKITEYTGLERFKAPEHCTEVYLSSDEVTALCPVTNQPDWYTVEVVYTPGHWCVESKTFKLLMHSYRNRGLFCEALAADIANEVLRHAEPSRVCVHVTQKPRGGVTIKAVAERQARDSGKAPKQSKGQAS